MSFSRYTEKSGSLPGGNVTGVCVIPTSLAPKRLELINPLLPKTTAVGALINSKNRPPSAELKLGQTCHKSGCHRISVGYKDGGHRTGLLQQRRCGRSADHQNDAGLHVGKFSSEGLGAFGAPDCPADFELDVAAGAT